MAEDFGKDNNWLSEQGDGALPDEDRELNKKYDEIVRSLLDGLVQKDILSKEDVKRSTAEQIEEFLDRLLTFRRFHCSGDFCDFKKDTIRSIFASSKLKQENANCYIGRQEVLNVVRNILPLIEEKMPNIRGFLIFGSSIDPKKIARFNDNFDKSDIDIIPVVQSGGGFDLMGFNQALKQVAGVSFLAKQIKATRMIAEDSLFEEFSGDWHDMPFWAKEPGAVYFVGSLCDKRNGKSYTEQEANELLQKSLHTAAYKAAKFAMLEDVREKILQERYQQYH